jgi:hypothetical protein
VHSKSGDVTAVRYDQINEFLKEHKKGSEAGSHRPEATERNGSSHSAAQRAVRANPEGERPARDEQVSGESGREQTLAVVHHNSRIIVCR